MLTSALLLYQQLQQLQLQYQQFKQCTLYTWHLYYCTYLMLNYRCLYTVAMTMLILRYMHGCNFVDNSKLSVNYHVYNQEHSIN